jgi:hypothetical protein
MTILTLTSFQLVFFHNVPKYLYCFILFIVKV